MNARATSALDVVPYDGPSGCIAVAGDELCGRPAEHAVVGTDRGRTLEVALCGECLDGLRVVVSLRPLDVPARTVARSGAR